MSFSLASSMTLHLLAFALFLQSLELWLVSREPIFKSVWSYENIRGDLEPGLPLPNAVIRGLAGERGFVLLIVAQILLSIAAFFIPVASIFVALTLAQLLLCFRFRGSFNGGSDMMTFVIMTGALIITLGAHEHAQRLGLLYIAIQAIYSYAKAGFAKLREREWRTGAALSVFLSRSLFTDSKRFGVMLRFKPGLARGFAWAF